MGPKKGAKKGAAPENGGEMVKWKFLWMKLFTPSCTFSLSLSFVTVVV